MVSEAGSKSNSGRIVGVEKQVSGRSTPMTHFKVTAIQSTKVPKNPHLILSLHRARARTQVEGIPEEVVSWPFRADPYLIYASHQ